MYCSGKAIKILHQVVEQYLIFYWGLESILPL